MTGVKRNAMTVFALAVTLVIASASWLYGSELFLADEDGRILVSHPIEEGESFTMRFIHSLAKSPVEEVFVVTGPSEFTLRETIYEDFGAGLPHEELPGQKMEFGDGKIRLSGYDVKFTELWVRVGHIAENEIIMADGTELRLADFQRRGGAVRITVGGGPDGVQEKGGQGDSPSTTR